MGNLKLPRHYRLARRLDAQQRAYDDAEKRRYQHYRRRLIVHTAEIQKGLTEAIMRAHPWEA